MNSTADLNLIVSPPLTTSTDHGKNGSSISASNNSGNISDDIESKPSTNTTTPNTNTTTKCVSSPVTSTNESTEVQTTPSSINLNHSDLSKTNPHESSIDIPTTSPTDSNVNNSTPITTSNSTINPMTNTPVTTTTTSESLSESLTSVTIGAQKTPSSTNVNYGNLSKTNLYIKGLQEQTTDQDLYNMCSRFGHISSTKAILDYSTRSCKGYGFVEFTTPQSAKSAVQELNKSGVQAQMAKISPLYNYHQQHHHNHHHHHHNNNHIHNGSNSHNSAHSSSSNNSYNNSLQQNQNSSNNNNNADPTNLYIANLPPNMSEQELENLLSTYGPVVSTRILRNQSNVPLGVGFARMESRDKCEQIIEQLNGRPCKGWKEPLLVKFADGGNKKRHHHNNQHQNQNNNHHQHRKVHQYDNRWRDNSNSGVLSSGVSNYEHQGNISHSNHLSDLSMMNTMSYPRMQPPFARNVATGAYPAPHSMGPSSSAPQWMAHPSGHQQYVISQQMIQPDGIGRTNQPAPMHYGHIPQLNSQMQALQIGHPDAQVGAYLPPQHQWPGLWTHPIPQQAHASMRMSSRIQPLPSAQQTKSPQTTPVQQQQPPSASPQSLGSDSKMQVSMPL